VRLRVSLLRSLLALAVLCACGVTAASAARAHRTRIVATPTTRPLQTAIFDPFLFDGSQQAQAFTMVRAAGGTYARIVAHWSRIAPVSVPLGFVASDPDSVGYSWTALDTTVAAARAAGLTPIIDIGSPPGWSLVPSSIGTGAGTPKLTALGDFATAVATHFDGSHGPAAEHVFQVWNEPNLSLDLSPTSPSTYRAMVNAFAGAVHAVNPSNVVIAGGLDPFGNTAARFHTMAPLAYMRGFLCMSKGKKPKRTCSTPAHFDVWSTHPYSFNGPYGKAHGTDNVSLGDLPTMDKLLETAAKLHQVVSHGPVKFWVTEFSWDTSPPRRHAAPVNLQARWTAEAFHQMWLSGVSLVTWFMLEDQPGNTEYQSGLYFYGSTLAHARAKPMRTAFRFPFVAYLGKNGAVSVWGRDATSSAQTISIQQRHGARGTWRTVGRIRANRYGIFLGNLKLKQVTAKDSMRATAARSGNSLPFSLTRPSSKLRYGPWGN